jgi:5'-nucleotidase
LAREPGLLPPLVGLNINYPPVASPAGVLVRQQGLTGMSGGQAVTFNIGCYGSCVTLPVGDALTGGITGFGTDDSPEVRVADSTAFSDGHVTIVPITPDYTADPANRFQSVFQNLEP